MFMNRPLVRALTLAFVGAVTVLPATAMADSPPANGAEHKHKAPEFPMDAKQFRDLVEKRIERARVHLNKQLEANKVPAATQAEIRKRFDDVAKQIRAAADRVGADGTVTKDEAKEVRHLAKDLRRKALAHNRAEKRARSAAS